MPVEKLKHTRSPYLFIFLSNISWFFSDICIPRRCSSCYFLLSSHSLFLYVNVKMKRQRSLNFIRCSKFFRPVFFHETNFRFYHWTWKQSDGEREGILQDGKFAHLNPKGWWCFFVWLLWSIHQSVTLICFDYKHTRTHARAHKHRLQRTRWTRA